VLQCILVMAVDFCAIVNSILYAAAAILLSTMLMDDMTTLQRLH
jgi:hypothetical protein